MAEITATINDETLAVEVTTEQLNINIVEEIFDVNIGEEQINVEIAEEVIEVNFGDVVAIIERELEQGIPYIDANYLYVVFAVDVKRTSRSTFNVDYQTFVVKPTTLAEVQALF